MNNTPTPSETEQACRVAAEQAAIDIPYVNVGETRPFQYHYQSERWYIEVDLDHWNTDEGSAVALYRVWKQPDGTLSATMVDIRETDTEDKPVHELDWKAIEAQAKADLEKIVTDQDAYAFIAKYFVKDLQADYRKLYRSYRHEMNRTPKQAINTLLSLPPIQ